MITVDNSEKMLAGAALVGGGYLLLKKSEDEIENSANSIYERVVEGANNTVEKVTRRVTETINNIIEYPEEKAEEIEKATSESIFSGMKRDVSLGSGRKGSVTYDEYMKTYPLAVRLPVAIANTILQNRPSDVGSNLATRTALEVSKYSGESVTDVQERFQNEPRWNQWLIGLGQVITSYSPAGLPTAAGLGAASKSSTGIGLTTKKLVQGVVLGGNMQETAAKIEKKSSTKSSSSKSSRSKSTSSNTASSVDSTKKAAAETAIKKLAGTTVLNSKYNVKNGKITAKVGDKK